MIAPVHPLTATHTLDAAAAVRWPIVVVGAGPAGALAAQQIACGGTQVLLVDRSAFPRSKVCGGCINAAAISMLESSGLGDVFEEIDAVPLNRFELHAWNRRALLSLPKGAAASRNVFDAALVRRAIDAGAAFLPETTAQLLPGADGLTRRLVLRQGRLRMPIEATVVLAADGLAGNLLRDDATVCAFDARRDARVGAGTITDDANPEYEEGTIYMACGDGGYVGVVRLEDGRLGVAAAFDRELIRQHRSLSDAANAILECSRLPRLVFEGLPWRGTPALTRQAPAAGFRLLSLGDAVGYVEPFTGEGIAAALLTAKAVVPFARQGAARWHSSIGDRWQSLHRGMLGRRARFCRRLTHALRKRRLMRTAVGVLEQFPLLAWPVVRYINSPSAWPSVASTPIRSEPIPQERQDDDSIDTRTRHGTAQLFD